MISYHAALIYTMVMVAASDGEMTDSELRKIGEIITGLPVFEGYRQDMLPKTAAGCAEVLDSDQGLDDALTLIYAALPPTLRETAYVLACDVAATDSLIQEEEMRMLEMLRERLELDPLVAAALERGARARFARK
jgi:tellurite resistance protein